MGHLEDVSVEELRAALDEIEGKKPTQRLLAAIAYKNGVTQTELAEWHGVRRRTVYNWLERLEDGPLARAAEDADRPGRRRKLGPGQQEELESVLLAPPRDAGYDVPGWTTALVREHVREAFGVEYSPASVRRLMRRAGLTYRPSRRAATGADRGDGEGDPDHRDGRSGVWIPR